ncbi:uncharacterized protein LOC132058508 [Lycium ferocissimum]|uniref:uncharacterized protein LOC132058508 n=1 Tax=Lycium ferocissimum TaxID=112874 RepID=UPI0028169627|nr:uncharacterized protein LOC132058508 [Lycium ferocissimum]
MKEFKSELNNLCTQNDDPKMKRQVRCQHGVLLKMQISWSPNNPGRRFWTCPFYGAKKCKFFEWRDDPIDERSKFVIHKLIKKMEEQAKELKKKMEEQTVELKKKMAEEVGLTNEMEEGESSCIDGDIGNDNSEMAIGNENITTNEEMKVLKVEEEMKVSKLEEEMNVMKLEQEKRGRCININKFLFLCFFGVVLWCCYLVYWVFLYKHYQC